MSKKKKSLQFSNDLFDKMEEKMQAEDIKRRRLNKDTNIPPELLFLQFKPKGKDNFTSFNNKSCCQPTEPKKSSTNKKLWKPPIKVFSDEATSERSTITKHVKGHLTEIKQVLGGRKGFAELDSTKTDVFEYAGLKNAINIERSSLSNTYNTHSLDQKEKTSESQNKKYNRVYQLYHGQDSDENIFNFKDNSHNNVLQSDQLIQGMSSRTDKDRDFNYHSSDPETSLVNIAKKSNTENINALDIGMTKMQNSNLDENIFEYNINDRKMPSLSFEENRKDIEDKMFINNSFDSGQNSKLYFSNSSAEVQDAVSLPKLTLPETSNFEHFGSINITDKKVDYLKNAGYKSNLSVNDELPLKTNNIEKVDPLLITEKSMDQEENLNHNSIISVSSDEELTQPNLSIPQTEGYGKATSLDITNNMLTSPQITVTKNDIDLPSDQEIRLNILNENIDEEYETKQNGSNVSSDEELTQPNPRLQQTRDYEETTSIDVTNSVLHKESSGLYIEQELMFNNLSEKLDNEHELKQYECNNDIKTDNNLQFKELNLLNNSQELSKMNPIQPTCWESSSCVKIANENDQLSGKDINIELKKVNDELDTENKPTENNSDTIGLGNDSFSNKVSGEDVCELNIDLKKANPGEQIINENHVEENVILKRFDLEHLNYMNENVKEQTEANSIFEQSENESKVSNSPEKDLSEARLNLKNGVEKGGSQIIQGDSILEQYKKENQDSNGPEEDLMEILFNLENGIGVDERDLQQTEADPIHELFENESQGSNSTEEGLMETRFNIENGNEVDHNDAHLTQSKLKFEYSMNENQDSNNPEDDFIGTRFNLETGKGIDDFDVQLTQANPILELSENESQGSNGAGMETRFKLENGNEVDHTQANLKFEYSMIENQDSNNPEDHFIGTTFNLETGKGIDDLDVQLTQANPIFDQSKKECQGSNVSEEDLMETIYNLDEKLTLAHKTSKDFHAVSQVSNTEFKEVKIGMLNKNTKLGVICNNHSFLNDDGSNNKCNNQENWHKTDNVSSANKLANDLLLDEVKLIDVDSFDGLITNDITGDDNKFVKTIDLLNNPLPVIDENEESKSPLINQKNYDQNGQKKTYNFKNLCQSSDPDISNRTSGDVEEAVKINTDTCNQLENGSQPIPSDAKKENSLTNSNLQNDHDVLDDDCSCLMISHSQLLEIEQKYYESCKREELEVVENNKQTSTTTTDVCKKTATVATQTEIQDVNTVAGQLGNRPQQPTQGQRTMIQETKKKLTDAIQEIERLNAILLKLRQEIWPQSSMKK